MVCYLLLLRSYVHSLRIYYLILSSQTIYSRIIIFHFTITLSHLSKNLQKYFSCSFQYVEQHYFTSPTYKLGNTHHLTNIRTEQLVYNMYITDSCTEPAIQCWENTMYGLICLYPIITNRPLLTWVLNYYGLCT